MKYQNIIDKNTKSANNVANEYSPMIKQQLFVNETFQRDDTENFTNRKRVGEYKNNS